MFYNYTRRVFCSIDADSRCTIINYHRLCEMRGSEEDEAFKYSRLSL